MAAETALEGAPRREIYVDRRVCTITPDRIDVRPALEDTQNQVANGVFEIKEHLAAIGLGLLPAYWLYWRKRNGPETAAPRRYLTWLLAFFVWWSFIVGHVLNDIRGLLP